MLVLVAFNAFIPLMTVVNYSVQETFGDNVFFWEGTTWFEQVLRSERFHAVARPAAAVHRHDPRDRGAARHRGRADDAAQGALGVGLPGADGAAAADPVERGRRDVEHLRAARYRPARLHAERDGHRLQLHPAAGVGLDDDRGRWTSGTGPRWSCCCAMPGLCSIPDAYYQAAQIDGASALGGVSLHPAAEDEARADHRRSCCASWTAS